MLTSIRAALAITLAVFPGMGFAQEKAGDYEVRGAMFRRVVAGSGDEPEPTCKSGIRGL